MKVNFDIQFIRLVQKQYKHGEPCKAILTCSRSNLITLIPNKTYMGFYLSCIVDRCKDLQSHKRMKRKCIYQKLLASRLRGVVNLFQRTLLKSLPGIIGARAALK